MSECKNEQEWCGARNESPPAVAASLGIYSGRVFAHSLAPSLLHTTHFWARLSLDWSITQNIRRDVDSSSNGHDASANPFLLDAEQHHVDATSPA